MGENIYQKKYSCLPHILINNREIIGLFKLKIDNNKKYINKINEYPDPSWGNQSADLLVFDRAR